ncbi:MAG: hypothetical protein D8B57_05720 [Prevotella sp.]|nr:MAG: hypothetical protein D8B57_05720 [Prevotella sp.]
MSQTSELVRSIPTYIPSVCKNHTFALQKPPFCTPKRGFLHCKKWVFATAWLIDSYTPAIFL